MTPKRIFFSALRGEPTPRVPVAPLAVHFCARVTGVSLHRYSSDAAALAEAVLRYYDRFRPDAIVVSADTWVSAQAMGATVGPLAEDQPWGGRGEPRVRNLADVRALPLPEVATQGRYPLMLDALRRVVAAVGGEVAVVACFDQFPFSLAAALMGINELMLALNDDPALVRALMARCHDYALAYGQALAAAGADVLTGGDSPAGLIGPQRYREIALPFERQLIAALKVATGKPVALHICGNAAPILADMADSGADLLEIDYRTDLALACRTVGPEIALWGNLDPVAVLAQGSAHDVALAARQALAAAKGHRRFVLGTGCTLAVETPFANVAALIAAVRL
ncbi:MAG: uroporphyrinogen decarboxylase family protein [Opitutaceae bacterium]|nr:uroporphyrinogen decarboxylase family protein [Opitutaceae bacterium]MBP9912409.1 uroporphyrinogen decarboxylase family protein [Opitutaceae bacterium]